MNGPTLLAFDFDGTLAPIQLDPATVNIDPDAAELLRDASLLRGVVVAVATGRDASDLSSRIDTEGLYLITSHGLEIRAPGGTLIKDVPPLRAVLDQELRDDISASRLRIESKKHGVALHWRGIPGADAEHAVVARFRAWGIENQLDVIEGRCVVDARVHGGGKEPAIRWLASATGAGRVLYAGDDLTDFGALRYAAQRGRALFIASAERQPPPDVTVLPSIAAMLPLVRGEVLL